MAGSTERERLHDQIDELRTEVGRVVQTLAQKADAPAARARKHLDGIVDNTIDRGAELRDKGSRAAARTRRKAEKASKRTTVRARKAAGRAAKRGPSRRWTKLAGGAAVMVTLVALGRKLVR